jgi:hypothetical protein
MSLTLNHFRLDRAYQHLNDQDLPLIYGSNCATQDCNAMKSHPTTEEQEMISLREGVAFALIVSSLTFVDKPHDLSAAGTLTYIGMSSTVGGTVVTWQAEPTILAQYNPCPGGRCGK